MKNIKNLPKSFQRLLWSYDINKIDLERDKKEVITQVLNHGDWQDTKKLFRLYSEEAVKEQVQNPRRGVWFDKVLNFWCKMFNVKLTKKAYQKAIFNIHPFDS